MTKMLLELKRAMEAEMSKKMEELEAKIKQMSTATTPETGKATSRQPGTKPQISQPTSTSAPPQVTRESSVTSRIQELEEKMKQMNRKETSVVRNHSICLNLKFYYCCGGYNTVDLIEVLTTKGS